jgi:hypothetical protein
MSRRSRTAQRPWAQRCAIVLWWQWKCVEAVVVEGGNAEVDVVRAIENVDEDNNTIMES